VFLSGHYVCSVVNFINVGDGDARPAEPKERFKRSKECSPSFIPPSNTMELKVTDVRRVDLFEWRSSVSGVVRTVDASYRV
jgi:hypothetical protein